MGESRAAVRRFAAVAAASIAYLFASAPASAQCGGICLYEVGSPQMGSAAAGASAEAQDVSTALWNPAGMSLLDRGGLMAGLYGSLVDLEFDADRSDTVPPPAGYSNDGGQLGGFTPGLGSFLVIPLADQLGDLGELRDVRFGFSLTGLFGGAASYDDDWVGRHFITDVALVVLNAQPVFSARVSDWLSVGVGANIFYARLSKFQLEGPDMVGKLKADGAEDAAPTFNLSALIEPCEKTRIGIRYQYKAKLQLTGGDSRATFGYDFELPQGFNVGIHHQLTPALALMFDAGWSDWSDFSQQSIVIGPVDVSFDRHWHDTWRAAGGFEYALADTWRVRGGISYDSSPVSAKHRTPDLPVTEQYRFSTGVQHDFSPNVSVGLSYTFLWLADGKVDHVAIPPAALGVVLDGEYAPAWAQFVGLSFQWRFCSPLPWVSCPTATASSS